MRILISNDDGVLAPGIRILANEIANIAEVVVVAPDRNRSGSSNALSLSRPLHITQLENGYYSVDGTPTDCVHLGLTGAFDSTFDIVLSGINSGANLGDDILYSGTVAAAIEGRFLGLPAIALSMASTSTNIHHYMSGAKIAVQLVKRLQNHPLPPQTILNVNIPDLPLTEISSIDITRLGKRHLAEPVIKTTDPRGRPVHWIGPPGSAADAGSGTDFFAINQHHVSITPLHLDLTNHAIINTFSEWMGNTPWEY